MSIYSEKYRKKANAESVRVHDDCSTSHGDYSDKPCPECGRVRLEICGDELICDKCETVFDKNLKKIAYHIGHDRYECDDE
jgi:hypothetical protein